jgi:hypothetical protein
MQPARFWESGKTKGPNHTGTEDTEKNGRKQRKETKKGEQSREPEGDSTTLTISKIDCDCFLCLSLSSLCVSLRFLAALLFLVFSVSSVSLWLVLHFCTGETILKTLRFRFGLALLAGMGGTLLLASLPACSPVPPEGGYVRIAQKSSPRPGTADLFFSPSADQSTLKRPPSQRIVYNEAPASSHTSPWLWGLAAVGSFCLGALFLGVVGWLLWTRDQDNPTN